MLIYTFSLMIHALFNNFYFLLYIYTVFLFLFVTDIMPAVSYFNLIVMIYMSHVAAKAISENVFPLKLYTQEVLGWYTKGCNDAFGFEIVVMNSSLSEDDIVTLSQLCYSLVSGKTTIEDISSIAKPISIERVRMLSQDLYSHLVDNSTSALNFYI